MQKDKEIAVFSEENKYESKNEEEGKQLNTNYKHKQVIVIFMGLFVTTMLF